jgi:hypothetical protein
MDRHYTPKKLAESIIDRLPDIDPRVAADFAVGEGALIGAIRRRWPKCKLLATDIDRSALNKLKRRLPKVSTGICDFLNQRSRRRSPILDGRASSIPLIFLNPPFSSRGDKIAFEFEGKPLGCSRALAFTALALPYLSSNGRLIALLPSSCLTSEKDAHALANINISYVVNVMPMPEPARFSGCSVDVVVVQFQRRKNRTETAVDANKNIYRFALNDRTNFRVAIVRGRVPMSDAAKMRTSRGWQLVHTTGLQDECVVFDQGKVNQKLLSITGPVILIPRVGRPATEKICFYPDTKPIVPSDCIIAIKAGSSRNTRILYGLLHAQARLLLQCYVGSCAKYLTLARLTTFMESLGVTVIDFEDMAVPETREATRVGKS